MSNTYNSLKGCPDNSMPHIIKSGDSLYYLAQIYETTVEDILAINPGINPNNLQIGQRICIPEGGQSPSKCPEGTFPYTIKKGDTLYDLARKNNTTVEEILKANPELRPNNLKIGQVICIPKEEESIPECDGLYYVVRPGDSLYFIASKCNVSVEEIIMANPGLDPDNLRIGQLICIPNKEVPDKDCPNGILYTVREADSLSSILLRFNISILDLKEGNPNIDIDNIRVGERLCILPHKERACPCPDGSKAYMIEHDDVYVDRAVVVVLAEKFNTSVSDLMKLNPNLSPGDFKTGLYICVPA